MSLYEKIGGRDAVQAAVEVFYAKVLADDRVRHFFDGVNMPGQMAKQRTFLAYAFGGPVKYSGQDLRTAHQHLDLTEDHFDAIAEHLQNTLKELNVADQLIDQAMQIVARTHDDVMNR